MRSLQSWYQEGQRRGGRTEAQIKAGTAFADPMYPDIATESHHLIPDEIGERLAQNVATFLKRGEFIAAAASALEAFRWIDQQRGKS